MMMITKCDTAMFLLWLCQRVCLNLSENCFSGWICTACISGARRWWQSAWNPSDTTKDGRLYSKEGEKTLVFAPAYLFALHRWYFCAVSTQLPRFLKKTWRHVEVMECKMVWEVSWKMQRVREFFWLENLCSHRKFVITQPYPCNSALWYHSIHVFSSWTFVAYLMVNILLMTKQF